MFWSKTFLDFFTFGLGVFFFLFMVRRLRYFESTKFLFYVILCLYLIVFSPNLSLFKSYSPILLELNNTSYFTAFLGVFLRFYLMKMIYPVKSFSTKNLKHFAFPLAVIIGEIFVKNIPIDKNIVRILQQFHIPIVNFHIPIVSKDSFTLILFGIGFSYVIASLMFILRFNNKQSDIFKRINKRTLIWLKIVICITALFMILELLLLLNKERTYAVPLVYGQHILIISLIFYVLLSPETVKKMRGCVYVIPQTNDMNVSFLLPRAFRGTTYDYWHSIIGDYISIKMPYLNMNFSASEMASDLSISKQKLVSILKYVYKMDFMEFVNRHRVYYFLELSNDKAFNSMHIEDQALRVGFYNTSDFYYYFRKYMNSLPPLNISQDKYTIKREIQKKAIKSE